MALQLQHVGDHPALKNGPAAFRRLIARQLDLDAPAQRRRWAYYANPARPAARDDDRNGSDRPYRQAQEWGLPSRLTGGHQGHGEATHDPDPAAVARKEIVVENDIGWRIDTHVDFLFGKPPAIDSTLDGGRGDELAALVRLIVAGSGGMAFLQRLALLGAVHGFADVLVHCDPDRGGGEDLGHVAPCDLPLLGDLRVTPEQRAALGRAAACVRLEVVPPAEALGLMDPDDPACLVALARVRHAPLPGDEARLAAPRHGYLRRLLTSLGLPVATEFADRPVLLDVWGPRRWQRYANERLVADGANPLGRVAAVRVTNDPDAAGDVAALMPLQDELNTRLSDRANRITMQSFKMYLGRGIDDFNKLPVRPGQMWQSDSPDADVIEFGTDAPTPSEDRHVAECRRALDKASGVSPVAAGVIEGRVGQLSSAEALRVTLMALLTRTDRKRLTYGNAVARIAELALARLDAAGVFPTAPAERGVVPRWASPLPDDPRERLSEAKAKLDLGIDPARVRRELGY